MKKVQGILKIVVCTPEDRSRDLQLTNRGLIGKFMALLPLPHYVHTCIDKNWKPLIQGDVMSTLCGKGLYTLFFKNRLDKDLVFKSGPYLMVSRGFTLTVGALVSTQHVMFPPPFQSGVNSPFYPSIVGMMLIFT